MFHSIPNLKILLVSPLPPPSGGIASWSESIIAEGKAHKKLEIIHIDTAVRWRSTNDFAYYKRILGGGTQAIRDIIKIYQVFMKKKPQVLHLCTSGSLSAIRDIIILRIAKILGIRSIAHYRMGGFSALITGNTWEWQFIRRAMNLADSVLLLDKKSEDAVRKAIPSLPVQVIPNPIDLHLIQKILRADNKKTTGNNPFRIIFVGHIIPSKGIYELINACLLLGESPFELYLVGKVENDVQEKIEGLAASLQGGQWLRFLGELGREEALRNIHEADLLVLPSHGEGFPNVVTEAMALGTPIVASRVGAVPEMLNEKEANDCGLVVNPKNVTELESAILTMMKDPGQARMLAKRAQQKANDQYSIEVVMERYTRLWSSLACNDPETSELLPTQVGRD
jgi:glycosyltransferase involved in cell wall biosynthesis